ncbi:S8 family peptidase [Actinocrispum sp. NPDC049592]|uniref:S8 family peptidase n=1 Tax=Actinocrispum sp. NPDC049592 TaxID=3154835 RepID=UPI00344406AE
MTPAHAETTASYIVVLNQSSGLANRYGTRVEHTYAALNGFSARLSQSEVRALKADKSVAEVVPDGQVHAFGEQTNPPSWGLDRIDQRKLPLDKRYRYVTEAANVTAYVIDTGVRKTHQDFGGRVTGGVDIVDGDGNPDDGNGHGTFIAGIIGGTSFGVAKKIRIEPVRVLDNSGAGSMSDVIAGIDWVTQNARKPAVVNMSLGGPANAALDAAVRRSIASGVTYVVAAGSSAGDASNFSPARVTEAITTSATGPNDCVHPPSNFGPVIDIYAPGVNITGPWGTSDTATLTASGTSFSSPHVAGGAGLYLATHPAATPAQVASALIRNATRSTVCNVPPNTVNLLLYTLPA